MLADHSLIEWTDATWNPITGCTIVDAGCTNCYAMGLAATRMKNHPSRAGLTRKTGNRHVWTGEVRLNEDWLDQPLRWTKPRMIFVCAHGDLFHKAVPDEWIDRVFAVMALCPQHTFQVLTKRPDRARAYLSSEQRPLDIGCFAEHVRPCEGWGDNWTIASHDNDRGVEAYPKIWPLPNVWLGTSISDQASWDARWPELARAPAATRFISAEPLLGPVQMHGAGMLDWLIVGGESGPNARPMHPDWARDLRFLCEALDIAFFFKQWGEWAPARPAGIYENVQRQDWTDGTTMLRIGKKAAGRLLDGCEWNELPKAPKGVARVRGLS